MSQAQDEGTLRRCPICSKPASERYRPFCSKRCADIDLNRWLKGGYAIPGAPEGEEDSEAPLATRTGEED